MSTVAEIKAAVSRLPQRQKVQIARWMQSQIADPPVTQVPALESALRHSLGSPLKKYQCGHFAALALRGANRTASE